MTLPPRLVVFDVPTSADLLAVLAAAFADAVVSPQTGFECVETDRFARGAPVWFWDGSIGDLRSRARTVLRTFAYPLVASGRQYCVAFPFAEGELARRPLDIETLDQLDAEDVGQLLCDDAVTVSFPFLHLLPDRVPLTPIEARLADALAATEIPAQPQVRFGPFRVDFLVRHAGRQIAVEADGRGRRRIGHKRRPSQVE